MTSPYRTTRIVLLLMVCSSIYLEYWTYSRMYHADPTVWTDVLSGTADAPAQYRVGVLTTAGWMARHAHRPLHYALTILDLAAGALTVLILTHLLVRSKAYLRAGTMARWLAAAVLCLIVANCLLWLTWYIRPETLTNALLLSLTLLLTAVRMPFEERSARFVAAAGMIALSVVGGFVRADLAVTVHCGILLAVWFNVGDGFVLPRSAQVLVSAVCCGLAAGCQLYLMRVRYPHATYGSSPVFMLLDNVRHVNELFVFVVALFPWLFTVWVSLRRRIRLTGPEAGVLLGSVIFCGMWVTVGRAEEVRIFLPYALVLAPLGAAAVIQRIEQAQDALPI